ncbi:MAG TPA: TIGR02679 family protein [Solirubrobacteraceae bacterium]|nr:TIGR02679 family protein [Solirubrobacteraceae bacterium]
MGHVDHERLTRLLGDPALAWVLHRVRRRLELGQSVDGTIAQRSATIAERDAVARLFGRPPRAARGLSVPLGELDALLRRSGVHSGGLAEAVITLTGPVTIRADAVADDARRWAAAFARIEAASDGCPELAEWIGRVHATGVVKRFAGGSPDRARELLDAVVSVMTALPASSGESLSAFAARVTGRAHALDDGSPLGTLAVGAARALAGLQPPGPDESPAEARREAWAAVGVLCDELSSTVLTLALPGDASATGRVLSAAGAGGEPVWLTLRQLVRSPPQWQLVGLRRVLVVENPSVVALAADTLRAHRTPIVCTNGQPRAAAMLLLRSLAAAGVRLFHHGDFDWGGLTIGNLLHRRLPVEAWQFDRDAYRRAVAAHPHAAPLTGSATTASWDPTLAYAMREAGRRIEEELVADELLGDLA